MSWAALRVALRTRALPIMVHTRPGVRHFLEQHIQSKWVLCTGAMQLKSKRSAFLVAVGVCLAVAAGFYGILVLVWA